MTRHQHKRTTKPLRRIATLRKGQISRRVIAVRVENGVEYTLHSTKGYRATRA